MGKSGAQCQFLQQSALLRCESAHPAPKKPISRATLTPVGLFFSKGEFSALGARGWLVGWHGTALGIVAMGRPGWGGHSGIRPGPGVAPDSVVR